MPVHTSAANTSTADICEAVSYDTIWQRSNACAYCHMHIMKLPYRQPKAMLILVANIHMHLCFLNLLRLAFHLRPFGFAIFDVYTPGFVKDVTVTVKCLWCFVAVKFELRWECHPHISAFICQR